MGRLRYMGYVSALISAIAGGISTILCKHVLSGLSPLVFNFIYFSAAVVMSNVYLLFRFRRIGRPRLDRSVVWHIALIGVLSSAWNLAYFMSLKLLDPTVATLFARMDVVLAAVVAGVFLGEKLNTGERLAFAVVLAGVAIMNWHTTRLQVIGFLWMLLACTIGALTSMLTTRCLKAVDPEVLVAYRGVVIFVVFGAAVAMSGRVHEVVSADRTAVVTTCIGAFFAISFGLVFFFDGLRKIGMLRTTAISQVTPLIVALLSLIFLHTGPTFQQAMGGSVVLIGVLTLIYLGKAGKCEMRDHVGQP